MRQYTVKEIDELRRCCETKFLYGFYRFPESNEVRHYTSRASYEWERSRIVEEMVRTHMLAGHTAKDLK